MYVVKINGHLGELCDTHNRAILFETKQAAIWYMYRHYKMTKYQGYDIIKVK